MNNLSGMLLIIVLVILISLAIVLIKKKKKRDVENTALQEMYEEFIFDDYEYDLYLKELYKEEFAAEGILLNDIKMEICREREIQIIVSQYLFLDACEKHETASMQSKIFSCLTSCPFGMFPNCKNLINAAKNGFIVRNEIKEEKCLLLKRLSQIRVKKLVLKGDQIIVS